jgi:hypothetical protein
VPPEDVEVSDTADALGVNAWPGVAVSLDDVEGGTARMVDFCGGEVSSSSISSSLSSWMKSDEGGVLSRENLMEGDSDEAAMVSASEALVDVECLIAFLCCKGLGTRVWLASILATALATEVKSETRVPLPSNSYPGRLRAGKMWDGSLGNGVLE